jgi:hypothetical protein
MAIPVNRATRSASAGVTARLPVATFWMLSHSYRRAFASGPQAPTCSRRNRSAVRMARCSGARSAGRPGPRATGRRAARPWRSQRTGPPAARAPKRQSGSREPHRYPVCESAWRAMHGTTAGETCTYANAFPGPWVPRDRPPSCSTSTRESVPRSRPTVGWLQNSRRTVT